jgi:hypothetical protein
MTNPSLSYPPINVHELTHAKIIERQLKGLYYNYDEKYFPKHKCTEQRLFMVISNRNFFMMKLKLYILRLLIHQLNQFPPMIHSMWSSAYLPTYNHRNFYSPNHEIDWLHKTSQRHCLNWSLVEQITSFIAMYPKKPTSTSML